MLLNHRFLSRIQQKPPFSDNRGMSGNSFFLADWVLPRLGGIFLRSARFLENAGAHVSLDTDGRLPETEVFRPAPFSYSFDFSGFRAFVFAEWFVADSSMCMFAVPKGAVNRAELQDSVLLPLVRSFFSEIEAEFSAVLPEFENFARLQSGSREFSDGFDFSGFLLLKMDILQIAPDDKKTVRLLIPRKMLFPLLCARQFPDIEALCQGEIDSIVRNFTGREGVSPVLDSGDSGFSGADFAGDSAFPVGGERANCALLSEFVSGAAKKMVRAFRDYREEEFLLGEVSSSVCGDSEFFGPADGRDFLVCAKIGGKRIFLKWSADFFAKTFLRRGSGGSLERIEREIFRREFAVPAFNALKTALESRTRRYVEVSSVSILDSLNEGNFQEEGRGYLTSFRLRHLDFSAAPAFYFPADSVEILSSAGVFSDPDEGNLVRWQFPAGNLKNTEISIGHFSFDRKKFDSGKTFVLEKEIGDGVEIFRNSNLIARGEVFLKNGKKFVRVREVFGEKNGN